VQKARVNIGGIQTEGNGVGIPLINGIPKVTGITILGIPGIRVGKMFLKVGPIPLYYHRLRELLHIVFGCRGEFYRIAWSLEVTY
jgi:hypothetical protein